MQRCALKGRYHAMEVPGQCSKGDFAQVLLGLDYIHSCGVVHGGELVVDLS